MQQIFTVLVMDSEKSKLAAIINQKLIKSGEKERLKEYLKLKLIDCGWRDQLKTITKDYIKERGLEKVNIDALVTELSPKGRAIVPEGIKNELLAKIRKFLAENE
jgi:enhancer of yellow 2 transcription factor